MLTKFAFSIVLVVLLLPNNINAGPPCNPAIHCHPESIECVRCNPSIEDCSNSPPTEQRPGICTNYQRPGRLPNGERDYFNFQDISIKQKKRRCKQLLDVSDGNQFDNLDFIASCPEGWFTCFDGFCTQIQYKCVQRCKKDPNCMKKGGSSTYQMRPIRWSDQRCTEDCRQEATIGECTTDGIDLVDPISQIPVSFPIPPQLCCTGLPQPNIFEVVLANYSADTCCPPIPEDQIIDDNILIPSDPALRIFNLPIDTYTDEQLGYELLNVTVEGLLFNPEETDECCCSLQCGCYGDPHCTAFDRNQRSSVGENVTFNMLREGPVGNEATLEGFLVVNITNGPRGIAENLTIKLTEDDTYFYKLDAGQAHGNCWFRIPIGGGSGGYVDPSLLPDALTENFNGIEGLTCPVAPLAPDVLFSATNEIYSNGVNIRYTVQKHHQDNYQRFDIFLDRYVNKREDCCPAPSILINNLQSALPNTVFAGFCYEPNSAEADLAFPGIPPPTRMLADRELENDEDTSRIDKLCTRYCAGIKKTDCFNECLMIAFDFGAEALEQEINVAMALGPCFNAIDPIFDQPLGECDSGLTLQATLKGEDDWQFVRAYPSDVHYCNGSLVIPFTAGERLTFQYDGNLRELDPGLFDVRFVERIDVPVQCNPCKTKGTVLFLRIIFTLFLPPPPVDGITCPPSQTCIPCEDGSGTLRFLQ